MTNSCRKILESVQGGETWALDLDWRAFLPPSLALFLLGVSQDGAGWTPLAPAFAAVPSCLQRARPSSGCPAVPLPTIAVFLNELRADESLIAGEKKIKSELD